MGFNCGIVGLPNVGKSTLFNALTATDAALAGNYPFCTIDPNIGRVSVQDPRLQQIADLACSVKVVPTFLELVDIAGLVKGANRGEGLGNQFLGHIRQVDAIVHILRCFEDKNITHTYPSVDPLRDKEIVETELMLADLESLEKRQTALEKKCRLGDKEAQRLKTVCDQALALLSQGKPARLLSSSVDAVSKLLPQLHLLTAQPILYVCNVSESDILQDNAYVDALKKTINTPVIIVSAAIEAQISQLQDAAEKTAFLDILGLKETGLHQIVRQGYRLLRRHTYFTAGPKESRAWSIPQGMTAPEAAGVIHTDFQRGYICAEVISFQDFITHKGEQGARKAGKCRKEGKDYVVQDGDIILFRFNV